MMSSLRAGRRFVAALAHASLSHDYDPVAAREYYLRTRELKGREPQEAPPPTGVKAAALQKATTERTKQAIANGTVEQEQKRKELEQKAEELKVRVKKMEALVKEAIEAAKKRSGMSEDEINAAAGGKTKASDKPAEGGDGKEAPKTAAEKKKAAKASEEYREENEDPRDKTMSDELANLEKKVENAQKKIEQLTEKLEKIRSLSSEDKPATK